MVDLHLFDLRPGHHEALRDDLRTPRLERCISVMPSAGIASAPPTEPWPASPSRPGSAVARGPGSSACGHSARRGVPGQGPPAAVADADTARSGYRGRPGGPKRKTARSCLHRSDRYRSDFSGARSTRHPSDSGIARDRGCGRRDDRRSPGKRISAARRAATVWPAVNCRVPAPHVRPTWPGGHRSRDRWPFDFERR